jgi:hypothetical protein
MGNKIKENTMNIVHKICGGRHADTPNEGMRIRKEHDEQKKRELEKQKAPSKSKRKTSKKPKKKISK